VSLLLAQYAVASIPSIPRSGVGDPGTFEEVTYGFYGDAEFAGDIWQK
jgi:hypothetical protein